MFAFLLIGSLPEAQKGSEMWFVLSVELLEIPLSDLHGDEHVSALSLGCSVTPEGEAMRRGECPG